MSRLATRAEHVKLCHALGTGTETLEFLRRLPAEDLRRFRGAVDELLFRQELTLIRRAAAIARWLPVWMLIGVSRWVLGPLLTGRIAGELPARRASRVVRRLPPAFIAEAAAHLDPRRVRDLILQIPVELITQVAQELLQRRDYLTIGHVIEFLSDDAIRAVDELVQDEGALLEIAFYLESRNRTDHLLRLMPPERVRAAILLVQDKSRRELWPLILALLANVSYALKHELGELAARQGEAVLAALVNAIHEEDLWGDVLPLVASLSPETRQRLANLPVLAAPGVLERIVHAATESDLWGAALSLVGLMTPELRTRVARIADPLSPEMSQRAAYAALLGEHWETLLDLVGRMSVAKQRELAAIVHGYGQTDPELAGRIATRAGYYGLSAAFATSATA